MSWNYRVLRRVGGDGEPYFVIHEVYYDYAGKPESCTCEAASASGDSANELVLDLAHMISAVTKPVLEVGEDGNLREYRSPDMLAYSERQRRGTKPYG